MTFVETCIFYLFSYPNVCSIALSIARLYFFLFIMRIDVVAPKTFMLFSFHFVRLLSKQFLCCICAKVFLTNIKKTQQKQKDEYLAGQFFFVAKSSRQNKLAGILLFVNICPSFDWEPINGQTKNLSYC